ncbi:DUF732 domain-containing protein [Mycobacterium celatum]|uniref:DUF732 domain-containing protein n=1 Tax=Mycobacterium celatum TaxID=28045 RepID=UPI000AB8EBE1|nr:DUF732 domain-containing protein [Mycobacterium celatum]
MLTKALLAIALVATTALQPALAYADPDSDFLKALNMYGIDLSVMMGHTITPQDAIELGHDICNDLHSGKSAEAETNEVYRIMPKITDKQAGNLVSAAQLTICPDTES